MCNSNKVLKDRKTKMVQTDEGTTKTFENWVESHQREGDTQLAGADAGQPAH